MGLSGIWAFALVMSLLGVLSYSPVAMIASMLVLVLSTFFASKLCGLLFGVKAYGESSLITGLILSLIFLPTLEVPQLIVFAFVGLIAGASKFVLTWRGRHIFNPAALVAVVIGLTGLSSATWWVATPILTPVVLLTALLALYKSKRFLVAGLFLAITVPVLLIEFLTFGTSFGNSLWLLLSWPLLFLAGVMLTEPLTLPPRKWQMYIVAVVVAVAFLIPLDLGPLQMTPALALILGNTVAAVLANRRAVILTFKKKIALTPSTYELVFETSNPLHHMPGQYMEFSLPHKKADFRGSRRSFSITSTPDDSEVTFGIKFYEPSSSFKKTLKNLKPGFQISATTIAGDFVLPREAQKPLLFVAGGIGITPFISQLRWLKETSSQRDIALVYAVSNVEEIAYKDVLVKSGAKVIIIAPSKPKELPKGWQYSTGTRINYATLKECVPDVAERWAYASGSTPFVQSARFQLRKLGVRSVKTDYFVGY